VYVDVQAGKTNWRDLYRLLIGFVTPRPIALVSSVSANGHANLAPFSWYNMVSANPPVVMVCPSVRRDQRLKDTLLNIRETQEFAVATVTEAIAPQMVRCGSDLPRGVSEWDFAGLTPEPARLVKPALVRESPVNIECRLRDVISFGTAPGSGNVVLGDIVAMHVADWVLADSGTIDSRKLRTVGRLGGAEYVTVNDPYELHIPEPPTA
jgi:flavin reductase (DIM6/NTAB) family NADH-FMN oxidoreductase RutF